MDREIICKACDGAGLLMDDEQWQYTCTVCGGDGVVSLADTLKETPIVEVDETNRTLE